MAQPKSEKDKKLADDARLLRSWRAFHREQLQEALVGLHRDVMGRLMAQLKDLRSARESEVSAMNEIVKRQSIVDLDGFTDEVKGDNNINAENSEGESNAIYGLDVVPPSDPPDVRAMSHDDAVEAMVNWFFENFVDPAHSTPWDGEYVHIWGGPYMAADELHEAFDEKASKYTILEAIEQIEHEGFEWAPADSRIQPDYTDKLWCAPPKFPRRCRRKLTQGSCLSRKRTCHE